jgi:hypothetical protein
MEETAEPITAANLTSLAIADDVRTGGWIRRLQPKRPVRTMTVVVLDIDPKDLLEAAAPDEQQPVQALGPYRPDPALRVGVRVRGLHRRQQHLGALGAEHIVEAAENFASWSRSTKRSRRPRSPSATSKLRACWVTQAPFGWAVTPARSTRRVSSSMKNNSYSRRSEMVSTVKKSQATIPAAWRRRNARHVVVVRRGTGSSP